MHDQMMPPCRAALSPQEQRVLALVAQGKTDRQIATELTLAYATVKYYLRTIYQKLGVSSRTAAAMQYYR